MRLLRTLPTKRLVALLAAIVALPVVGVAIAVAASSLGPTPAPKPLAEAVHDALTAAAPPGLTARVTFTNGLLPSGALTGQAGSPLISGASGRLWITNDGRGRLELQSNGGDAQIVWNANQVSIYDASTNTDYRLTLPQDTSSSADTHTPPTIADISKTLTDLAAHWTVSGAQPTDVAGEPAYDVRISPKADGGLLDSAEIAWDALRGVPLRVAVYAKGVTSPVLDLTTTQISFGPVDPSVVDISPPAGAKIVDVPTSSGAGQSTSPAVTGLAAVQAAVSFPIVAPDSLGGQARTDVRLVGHGASAGALLVYGDGLGAVAVLERPTDSSTSAGAWSGVASLPTVSVGGMQAHELATPLGTILSWQQGSVQTVLAGSVTAAAAEADAAGLH